MPKIGSVPGPGARRHARRAGFTLVELMIVVAIAALVMATAVPFVQNSLRKDPLRQATSDIVEACNTARARAILSGSPAELRINLHQRTLEVAAAANTNATDALYLEAEPPPPPSPVETSGRFAFAAAIPLDVAIEMVDVNFEELKDAEEARVRFFPNSTSDEFTMIVERGGQWRKITLEVVTGLAEVENDPNRWR